MQDDAEHGLFFQSFQGRCPMPGSMLAQNLCSKGRKESSGGLTLPPGTLVLEMAIGLSVWLKLRRSPDPPAKCLEELQRSCLIAQLPKEEHVLCEVSYFD
uniref:Uncharacterized protein n=1 Tax=Corvus moneduloides TaxID=1196302 RepID=A0A8C3GYX1_CORMO